VTKTRAPNTMTSSLSLSPSSSSIARVSLFIVTCKDSYCLYYAGSLDY
jgi:hypothetical protein